MNSKQYADFQQIRQSWREAVIKVQQLQQACDNFHTLRDRQDATIQEDQLQIVKKYGSGQFGTVMKCSYKGKSVAVKWLKKQFLNTEDEALFQKEIKLLRKLRHPNIVNYIGTGYKTIDGKKQLYIAQESIEGGCLQSLVLKQCINFYKKLYTIMDAYNWVLDIAKGMQYLHNSRPTVIHRDLKLQNIMLNPKSERTKAVIVDFGVHTLITKTSMEIDAMETDVYNLTGKTGSYIYMAPEVFLQQPYNEKVDVYSYGIIVWELFSRSIISVKVAPNGTPQEIINYAKTSAYGTRQKIPESWPKQLQNLVQDCWNQDPQKRPSFDVICDQLNEMEPEILCWYQGCNNKHGCCTIM